MTHTEKRLEDTTGKDLIDPLFNAIWDAIKGWDLERERGEGYAGATGTDVMTILNVVRPSIAQAEKSGKDQMRETLGCICKNLSPASVHFKDCPLGKCQQAVAEERDRVMRGILELPRFTEEDDRGVKFPMVEIESIKNYAEQKGINLSQDI